MTFNDHEGSTKSYAYVKDHDEPLGEISFVPLLRGHHGRLRARARRSEVTMHDGSTLFLKKLDEDYDPTDKAQAIQLLAMEKAQGRFLTGMIYLNAEAPSLIDMMDLVDTPIVHLPESKLRPSRETLDSILKSYSMARHNESPDGNSSGLLSPNHLPRPGGRGWPEAGGGGYA